MPSAISSVKIELQKMKMSLIKIFLNQNDNNIIILEKYEDPKLKFEIWLKLEKIGNWYTGMYKNIACNINELTLYLQKVTKSIKKCR